MGWIRNLGTPGHITEAIYHFNQAINILNGKACIVEVSRHLFDALNKIQTEWGCCYQDLQDLSEMGEIKRFQKMIEEGLETRPRNEFLKSDELRNFVFFKPQIMNHDTLRSYRYRPDVDIEPKLLKKATKEHHKLELAYNKRNDDLVLKRTTELLYIVRSNIAHGKKTPYGPDLKKKERDKLICNAVVPLQCLLIDFILNYPSQKLIIYGTLAPEMPNNYIISDLQGTWEKCWINGYIDDIHGFPVFHWDTSRPSIEMQLFVSSSLPEKWSIIDEFEGSSYKRRLITAKTNNGITVANIYMPEE